MVSFAELSLTSFLADRLQQAGFTAPTPIQSAAIPLAAVQGVRWGWASPRPTARTTTA